MQSDDHNRGTRLGSMTAERPEPRPSVSDGPFREILENLQQVFWVRDAVDAGVLYVSPAYAAVWGRPCQGLLDGSHTLLDAIYPEDRKRVEAAMAGQHQTERYEVEYRIGRPDGTTRLIWERSCSVRDGQGRVVRFAGVAEDITERKALEHDRARLAAIVEYSEDAIVSMSMDGVIISWNRGAERQYGYTPEEVLGCSISILFPADHYHEYMRMMEDVRKGHAILAYDTVRRRKDGTLISMSVGVSPIETRDEGLVGSSIVGHNITDFRELEGQFRQAQKMEGLGRLAAGVAHDFNNLVTVISGYSQLLVETIPPGEPAGEMLREIMNAGDRAASLTRHLLDFSGKRVTELRVVDLNAVVANSENMLKRLLGEDVDMVTVLDPALGRLRVDGSQLEQALLNLAINARDAMPRGGKLTIETANMRLDQAYVQSHTEVNPGAYVMLAVSDTGSGMDDETKATIFEPFFTTKGEGKGTGLGLAMIHGFVKQSGGHIFVYSEPGLGTTFKIYLPECLGAVLPTSSVPVVEPVLHGDETVLLVEDEAAVRTLARHVLQKYGYNVLAAAQGTAAIQLAVAHGGPIQVLVTDVVMPGIDGRQLADRITALKPGIKVLFLSGYADAAVVRHGILSCERAFLQKPFTPEALVRQVRRVLAREAASPPSPSPHPSGRQAAPRAGRRCPSRKVSA